MFRIKLNKRIIQRIPYLCPYIVLVISFVIVILYYPKSKNEPQESEVLSTPAVVIEAKVDKDMKDSIFSMITEEPNIAIGKLVHLDGNGNPSYDWQSIGKLLRTVPEDMKIEDYAALIQVLQGMTVGQAGGAVSTDYKAMQQFVQWGCDESGLTLTMANVCTLYKEWVEDVFVAPQSRYLYGYWGDEYDNLRAHLEGEMLKAGILNGILLADNKIAQQGKQDSANIPMIRIDLNNRDHIIQFGDQAVEVSRFRSNLYTNISGVISSPSISKSKKEEMIQLYNLVDAYAMGGVIAVTEEFNIQMIICFNETELEIRTRAFSSYMFEENEKTKGDPKYKDIIRLTLKAQLEADEPSGLMNEYIEYINEQRMLQKYRNKLANVYDKYKMPDREDFFGISLERLTPVQIIELDKKLKDEKYHLDLGDPP